MVKMLDQNDGQLPKEEQVSELLASIRRIRDLIRECNEEIMENKRPVSSVILPGRDPS